MKLGRPRGVGKRKLDIYRVEIEALIKNGSTQKFITKRYHATKTNLHHWLKQRSLGGAKARPFFIAGFVPLLGCTHFRALNQELRAKIFIFWAFGTAGKESIYKICNLPDKANIINDK